MHLVRCTAARAQSRFQTLLGCYEVPKGTQSTITTDHPCVPFAANDALVGSWLLTFFFARLPATEVF